jgi:predicted O-methyltransferase YrrM
MKYGWPFKPKKQKSEQHSVEGWLSSEEGEFLRLNAQGGNCLEIGSYKGKSASYIATSAHSLVCIDPFLFWDGSKWIVDDNLAVMQAFLHNIKQFENITVIKSTSAACAGLFKENHFDMIFIDGSHVYENVLEDIRNYYPKLRKGGALLLHDYSDTYPGVQRAVQEQFESPDEVVGTIAKIIRK